MGNFNRSVSESSDDIQIVPLELGDLRRRLDESSSDEDGHDIDYNKNTHSFSSAMGLKKKKGILKKNNSLAKMAWVNAAIKARSMEDPWEEFHLNNYPTERAIRHRYNALGKCWIKDTVCVKMEVQPFNHGAMRECFRMKKLSNFTKHDDWSRAYNYVAKRYMSEEVFPQMYFDDVKLQMDAKLWGEEYNRHNPPKKVDIFQMAVLEMCEREGSPMFHVEHFIEGNYVKYNSNSGFVRSEAMRMTPQAFSHFTFERSGHELIVVDIQGVGDLYTDPQIHTAAGNDYGDGNLGTRGMALFFHSHFCNSICRSLGLSPFDLAPSENMENKRTVVKSKSMCDTIIRGTEEHVILPTEDERRNIHECLRLRSLSSGCFSNDEREFIDSIVNSSESINENGECEVESSEGVNDSDSAIDANNRRRMARVRLDSSTSEIVDKETKEQKLRDFSEMLNRKARPSHIVGELKHQQLLQCLQETDRDAHEKGDRAVQGRCVEHSVLGQVHLDLAKYHELCRFVEEEDDAYDKDAALFHLENAGNCGLLEAMIAMAQLQYQMPHDVLPDLELDSFNCSPEKGFHYLLLSAQAGDRGAMVGVAKALHTGVGLPERRTRNWLEAVHWYNRVVNTVNGDREGNFDGTMDNPIYQLVATQAQMYLEGGYTLDSDPNKAGELYSEAAELATEAMKGKLAAKYYEQAELAWADCEEEE